MKMYAVDLSHNTIKGLTASFDGVEAESAEKAASKVFNIVQGGDLMWSVSGINLSLWQVAK